jgi:uncharacterized protein involved in exopolysaccharide biosynthesis
MIEAEPQRSQSADVSAHDRDSVSFAWILAVLLHRRRFVLMLTGLGLVLAATVSSLRPRTYTSSFTFTPQSSQDQSRSGLATLAGQFGLALPSSAQNPQLYADLLETRGVLDPIVRDTFVTVPETRRRLTLAEFFGIRGSDSRVVEELTIRRLRTRVIDASAATRTTGVIGVSVRTTSPDVSFEIAKRLLEGLNQFNLATRKSQAGEERRFIESRLQSAKAELRVAEDALQRFLATNRQFLNSSQLAFQQERLQRDVTLQQQVVTGLSQQYEDARIREVRDTPVITVIERPVLPAMADPRGRVVATILGAFVGFSLAVAWVLLKAGWHRQREADTGDPSYSLLETEWQTVRRRFRRA